ncbi:MAG TPA: thiol-disulfide oxidoreductase DCC family protein [Chitinophagaceae bacterium]
MTEPKANPIVLFDGVCNLCNRAVQFIIKRDKKKQFRFASLQGKKGHELLQQFGLPTNEINSFILVENNQAYTRSTGGLRMLKKLGGKWKLLYALMIFPRFVRDAVYNWIARNRYKWYGKREECMIPTPELKERFLD